MNWLNVALDYNDEFFEVVISGKKSYQMAKEINSSYFPNILIAASKKDSDKYLLQNYPFSKFDYLQQVYLFLEFYLCHF